MGGGGGPDLWIGVTVTCYRALLSRTARTYVVHVAQFRY